MQHRLSDYVTVQRQDMTAGRQDWVIHRTDLKPYGRWLALSDGEADALVAVVAPDLIRACHAALPLVGALCGALAETCDEEAANALGLLREIVARYPQNRDTSRCSLGVGCDETGVCYAAANGRPEQCGAAEMEVFTG